MKIINFFVIAILVTLLWCINPAFAGYSNFDVQSNSVGSLENFTEDDSFYLFDYPWNRSRDNNLFGKVIGGVSMDTISWTQPGFSGDIISAVASFATGGWGNLSGLPELYLNGNSIGTFGSEKDENVYSLDIFDITPYANQSVLSFCFEVPHTSGTGWNQYFELGVLNNMTVTAFVDNYTTMSSTTMLSTTMSSPPISSTPVPEPTTMLLFSAGLFCIAGYKKKFR